MDSLPPHVGNLEDQAARRLKVLHDFETDFERYAYLRDLQDTNETLFYALLVRNLEEMMPLVYTPTVGEGCQRFSEIWRKPRGLFLSYPNQHRIREILAASPLRRNPRDCGERRRAHPRPRRSGRGRHGHSHRQARALHRLRRHTSRRTASPSCSTSAPTTWRAWKTRLRRLASSSRARRRVR